MAEASPWIAIVDDDPAVLKALQNHQSNLGGCPYLKWPKCDGLIQY